MARSCPFAEPDRLDIDPALILDPPQHPRLRKLVTSGFTVRRVQALRPRAPEIADVTALPVVW